MDNNRSNRSIGELGPGWVAPPNHSRESERLAAVAETALVGRPPDNQHQDVVRLAAQLCGTPIAAVSLVDADRQWFSGSHGLPVRETPRSMSFCAHAILGEAPLIVPDATLDDRFSGNPLVTGELNIRCYAGVPLVGADGLPLGGLCVIDTRARKFTPHQIESLKTLAELVSSQLTGLRRDRQLAAQNRVKDELYGRLTKIASCLPGVIYQFRLRPDGTSCFPYASARMREIYGVTPEQVRYDASPVFTVIHSDDLARVSDSIDESARTLNDWKCEFRVRLENGTDRWLLGHSVPEREPDGSILWHGFIKDISDRKRTQTAMESLNADLDRARQQAEAASRSKSAFLANMSHEIRTPLTAILGYADLLLEGRGSDAPPSSSVQSLETIRNAGTHLMAIINDILDLSKIEADRMALENIDTSPITILRDVVDLLRPKAVGKGITLSAELTTPVPTRIVSDPTRLRQILMNLTGNAIKFTEAGGVSISMGVSEDATGSHLLITVTDTGLGMTADAASRLFTPFGQGDETTTRRFGGTGLGLTICHRLARLMGGNIELTRTAVGLGSSFRLSMPLTVGAGSTTVSSFDEAPKVAPIIPATPRLAGRILLAEDGPDNQRLISFHLRKAGAIVEIAGNGRVALEMLRSAATAGKPFDLLLTDIQMPEMDGYTLTRTLRNEGNQLPIVALTAHALPEDRSRCLSSGCNAYLSKPIDKASLLATCSQWITRPETAPALPEAA